MTDNPHEPQQERTHSGSRPFGIAFFGVVAAAIAFTFLLREAIRPPSIVGQPAPQISAAGWLNGPGPTENELSGKVIVVDAWAYWCGYCRKDAPALLKLYEQYRDQGVVFLGLTAEGEDANEKSQEFLKETGSTWPNGYGAVETLQALHGSTIPQKWVFDRHNRVIWDQNSSEPIESAIDRALKEKP